jgi:hypothetical protein
MNEMMKMRETAIRAWVSIWYVVYVVLRVLLRYLIGKHRRRWVLYILGLHYSRAYSVRYGSLFARYEPHVYRVVFHRCWCLQRLVHHLFLQISAEKEQVYYSCGGTRSTQLQNVV